MEILFLLLLLLHATLTSAGEPPKNQQLDRQSHYNDNVEQVSSVLPVLEHPESVRQSERHFWHWLHKQHKQSELHHKTERGGRSRRWKEVANGEDDPVTYRVMLDKDEVSQSQHHPNQENRSAHDEESHGDGGEHNGIHVASWRWDEIGIYITFTTFIIVAGLAKVGN
jgi:arylsulfatase A-like enzyme